MRNKFVMGGPEPLRSSKDAPLCSPNFTVGTAITDWGNSYAMRVIRFWSGRGHVEAFNCKGKVGAITIKDSRVKAPIRIS